METNAEYNIYIFACDAENLHNNKVFIKAMNDTISEVYGGCYSTNNITSDELLNIVQNILTRMRQEELINGIQTE